MKSLSLKRALILLAGALPVPFLFNSCRGNLLGGTSFASSTCNAGLAKNQVIPFGEKSPYQSKVFSLKKSRLASASAQAGQELAVILNNSCLSQQINLDAQPITKAIRAASPVGSAPTQAHTWAPARDYTADELEAALALEPCIQGLALNKTYNVQSLAFNDPGQGSQTYLASDAAFAAWNGFYGPTIGMAADGTSVVIAVIDTGADYTHPDLQGHMWAGGALGVGVDIPSYNGATSGNYYPIDISPEGHGTHVSGMIAAGGNNATGIIGMMPYRASIMSIRLFGVDQSGNLTSTSQGFYNAIHFAITNHANVINLSLGEYTAGPSSDAIAERAIDDAIQAGLTVVTAIGNAPSGNGVLIDGKTQSSLPGMYASKQGVIGVGAYDTTTGQKSFFSDYSTTFAEIGAPGAESASTGLYSTLPQSLGSYGRLMGTSQAAPQVTAAAALTIGLIRNSYALVPTPAEVERLILLSARQSTALSGYFQNGNYLDLTNLLKVINTQYPLTATGGHVNLGCN